MKEQYLEVGKVTNVHGLMGEVRVQPWADSPDFLCRFKTLYVDKTHWPIQVERARVHKNMVIIKFHGVTDVNGALAMRNAILYIDRKCWARWPTSSRPPPTTCMWCGAVRGKL